MTMYKAVGWNSQNEYRIGNTLADVMRKLQKEYPAPRRASRGMSTQQIYSESLCSYTENSDRCS